MTDVPPVVLEVRNLSKVFMECGGLLRRPQRLVHALDGVSFDLRAAETLGVVGESGSGKSTLARTLVRLHEPSSGQVRLCGRDLLPLRGGELAAARARLQMVFQDPDASLNPRMPIGRMLEEPLALHGRGDRAQRRQQVRELLQQVGIQSDAIDRHAHEFSSGQRQRIGIARALVLRPEVVICDEPVSALDVSVQSQVLNLLRELQARLRLSYLFISHDLSVVRYMSDRVAVMYLGRVVELADAQVLYQRAQHPYTRALLRSVPTGSPRLRGQVEPLGGEVPSPSDRPTGCHFHPRCSHQREICRREAPLLVPLGTRSTHQVACHLAHSGELPPPEPVDP